MTKDISTQKGAIYVLTNPSFPEYVKIGYADDLEKRLGQLNRSECLPFAFRAYCIYETNERLKDKDVHCLIDRINPELRAIEQFDGRPRIREFYNITAEDAYEILYSIAAISGTTDRLKRITPEGHEVVDEQVAQAVQDSGEVSYTEDDHLLHGSFTTKRLYEILKTQILEFDDVVIEPKKLYVAFKKGTNFCDVEIQRSKLKIILNIPKHITLEPSSILRNISKIGHWGNGDYELSLTDEESIPEAMKYIRQAYDLQR